MAASMPMDISMEIKKILLFAFFAVFLIANVVAQNETLISSNTSHVYYFYRDGCAHCANVEASGILEKLANETSIEKLDINDQNSRTEFMDYVSKFKIPESQAGTPLAVIEFNGKYAYLLGDSPIISKLEDVAVNHNANFVDFTTSTPEKTLTLWAVILASLVDSLNPCALGVLAFLMICLLKLGSAKRALKAGIIYSFVVFLVYILSGFGIFKVIQSFTGITHYMFLGIGILVLILGALQLIDFIFPGKFISLRIPVSAKPMIERIAEKGTLPAIILLGALVALFELPCTGGIYIGILALLSTAKAKAIEYLIVYNLLFILPLLIATFIIYKGTNPTAIEHWSQSEKPWMKLGSGLVMIALGIYILFF